MQRHDLHSLELPFTEQEVLLVIQDLTAEKAPGSDGFIGRFFKSCWITVKDDVMSAMDFFFAQHDQHFKQLNTLHMVLLPKKLNPGNIGDYRPISLTHSVAKLISKVLATRLAEKLNILVSRAQSAFINKRCIQDNFLYTQNVIRELQRAKVPALFLKLDIAKAFDSVRWDYLLEVLEQLGFGPKWRYWVLTLLSSATTSVLLNDARGRWFTHRRRLRQGDPLSPMLFILAMDPLQKLMDLATREQKLSPIQHRAAKLRISLFADDAVMFINPVRDEVKEVADILQAFGMVSGLRVNHLKSAVYPIRCEGINVAETMQWFQCPIKCFPCSYLGLRLHFRKLQKLEIQPLIDKVAARLPGWKGKLLNKAGRLKVLNTMLTSVPVYHLTVFNLQKWATKKN